MFFPINLGIGAILKGLTAFGLMKVAIKTLIVTALALILPVCLYNGITMIVEDVMNWVITNSDLGDIEGIVIELTGLAGYLGSKLKIAESISMLLTAMNIKFILSFIR